MAEVTQAAAAAGFSFVEGVYAQRTRSLGTTAASPDLAVPLTSIATLELHRFELTDPIESRRARARESVQDMIAIARTEKIRTVSFSPGRVPAGQSVADTLEKLLDELRPLAQMAADAGVRLCLENLPGHALQRRTDMTWMLERLPTADVCFDCGNALVDPPQAAWLEALGPRIRKIHVSDGRVSSDRFDASVPGDGDTDWSATSGALRALPHAPELFVEAMWTGSTDEHAFLSDLNARAIRALGGER